MRMRATAVGAGKGQAEKKLAGSHGGAESTMGAEEDEPALESSSGPEVYR